mgnify:CR=1 FL=1|tara:strand:- start:48 stop:410 length:363 start_codon:yes stop_codon:yes gene_type:complete
MGKGSRGAGGHTSYERAHGRPDPRIEQKRLRLLRQLEREGARDVLRNRQPDRQPEVPTLDLDVSSVENMPLQPSPPEPEPIQHPDGSTAPIPKRDKSGAPKKHSVRRPYNWKNVQSNVRY